MILNRLEMFNQHRPLLFSIAYNMLGSAMDAEDMVQDTFLRWQQVQEKEIESPKAYLASITTNLCINYLNSARIKRESYIGTWLPEPIVTEPSADPDAAASVAESLSMAFLVVLESLSPPERAAFLLRQIFDYEYAEIATILGKNEANCRQLVHRARQRVTEHRHDTVASAQQHQQMIMQFMSACTSGDMQALLALFTEDCVSYADGGGKFAAALNPIYGADKISRYLLSALKKIPAGYQNRLAVVNGLPGIVGYVNDQPFHVLTFEIEQGRIRYIYNVANPEKLKRIPPLKQ